MPYRAPHASRAQRHHSSGFSLIELVIVVVIIGIIGAIAIPRLSRGSEGANSSKLKQDLAVMNKAVDMYAAEHGGKFPDASSVMGQLLYYTDAQGTTSLTETSTHIYGPYLRKIPPAPGGESPGSTWLSATDAPHIGWLYNETHGRIFLNRTGVQNVNEEDADLGRLRD